jgi:hypothetical protein
MPYDSFSQDVITHKPERKMLQILLCKITYIDIFLTNGSQNNAVNIDCYRTIDESYLHFIVIHDKSVFF